MKIPKRVLAILAVLALVIVAAGAVLLNRNSSTPKSTAAAGATYTQVVDVKQGSVASTISVVGQLEAVQSADLTFEHMSGSAKLVTLAVKAGTTVTTGQVLATIDPATYQTALDQAKSDYQAAQEKLADLKTPATALQIAKADLAVAQAEYNLLQAQDTLNSLLATSMSDLESAATDARNAVASAKAQAAAAQYDTATQSNIARLQDAEAKATAEYNRMAAEPWTDNRYTDALQVALNKSRNAQDALITAQVQQQISVLNAQIDALKGKQTLASAEKALATAKSGGDTLALAKARLAVESAKVALDSAKNDKTTLTSGADATTLAAAQADADRKKLALADAQAALDGTKLTAPFAGTVLQTNTSAGNLIGSNTKIMTVADLTSLRVAASVDETTIKKIAQGQSANVTFDALPGQTLKGTVGEIPLQGTLQGSVMVYNVPVTLTGAEKAPLLVGMTANVKVQSASATDALMVPTMALQRVGAGYQVTVVTDANPTGTAVAVEIGVADGSYTQITKGLKAGDKILITTGDVPTPTPSSGGGQRQFQGGFPPDGGGPPGGFPSR